MTLDVHCVSPLLLMLLLLAVVMARWTDGVMFALGPRVKLYYEIKEPIRGIEPCHQQLQCVADFSTLTRHPLANSAACDMI